MNSTTHGTPILDRVKLLSAVGS